MTQAGSDAPHHRNRWWLVAVAAGFGVLQLTTAMGLRYPFGHDETVYLSHVNPAMPAFPWGAHRALGMPLLVAPASLTDLPLPAVRLYLILLSSAGLLLAYLAWFAVRDTIAIPVAAALFGTTYVVTYHAGIVMPNYYTALGAVAATGLFIGCRRGTGGAWAPVLLALAIAVTALVRPTESLWLVLPFVVIWLGFRAWRRLVTAAAIGAGMAVGWGVWCIEAFVRFGSPVERMRTASEAVGGAALHLDLATVKLYVQSWSATHLECYRGNLPCELTDPIRPEALVWGLAAVGFLGYGVVSAVRQRRTMEVAIPLAVAASLAFSYLFMLRYGALRFLLPAGAVLSIPVAGGLLSLARLSLPQLRLPRLRLPQLRRAGAVLAAIAVIGHIGVNQLDLRRLAEIRQPVVSQNAALVKEARQHGLAAPCAVLGDWSHSVAYQLGCDSWGKLRSFPEGEPARVARARRTGMPIVVVLRRPPPQGSFLDSWLGFPADYEGRDRWRILRPPEQAPPSAVHAAGSTAPTHPGRME